MAITREQLCGAIKLINANRLLPRRDHLRKLLGAEHSEREVAKVLADLESYPDWVAGANLDAPAPVSDSAVPSS